MSFNVYFYNKCLGVGMLKYVPIGQFMFGCLPCVISWSKNCPQTIDISVSFGDKFSLSWKIFRLTVRTLGKGYL